MDGLRASRTLRIGLATSSGILYALSIPGYDVTPLAFVALVPLLIASHERRWTESALLFFVTGTVVSLISSVWVFGPATSYSGQIASSATLIYAGISVAHGIWFSCVPWLSSFTLRRIQDVRNSRERRVLGFTVVAAAWIIVETLHEWSFAAIPWTHMFLSSTQWLNGSLLQWASVGGASLISAIVLCVNVIVADALTRMIEERFGWTLLGRRLLPAAIVAGFVHLAGSAIAPDDEGVGGTVSVAMLQENIGAPDRWDDAFVDSLARTMLRLNTEAARQAPDLILWSETAIPWTFEEDDDLLTESLRITRASGAEHLVGMLTPVGNDGNVLNSMYLVRSDGAVTGRYDKQELLAFLERPLFSAGKGGNATQFSFAQSRYDNIVPGQRNPVIATRFGYAGVLICNEALTPTWAREAVNGGADFLVVSSNDAWFAGSALTRMHLAKTVLRAVETRRNVVFNANRGYAGVVRRDGTFDATELNGSPRVVRSRISRSFDRTAATAYPSAVPSLAMALIFLITISPLIRRRFV